jgi:hypothetical protein
VDYVAGAIVAENLMTQDDAFIQTRSEAEDLALSARLGSGVQFIRGALQAQSGSRFDVAPGQAAPAGRAPRSSQLGDGMFAVVVDQQTGGQRTGAKDLYVLGIAEVKLQSQVRDLPAQVAKTHERLEAMGVRIGNDLYLPAEQARPGQNRLFTAADLRAPIRWIIAAPYDAQPAGGWGMLQQRTSDRGAGRPARNVRVIRLGLPNAAIRSYAEHLLDILTEDDAQPESP